MTNYFYKESFLYPGKANKANKAYQPGILFFAFHGDDEYSFNRYLNLIGRELRLNL